MTFYGARVVVRRAVRHAALHAPCAPRWGGFARRAERRLVEHAYWCAVLLGMQHCMPLRPLVGRLCAGGTGPQKMNRKDLCRQNVQGLLNLNV
jgi:hypothetical protein